MPLAPVIVVAVAGETVSTTSSNLFEQMEVTLNLTVTFVPAVVEFTRTVGVKEFD